MKGRWKTKEWQKKESAERRKYFAANQRAPDRRAYVKEMVARHQALDKIRETQMNEMQQLTGGLNIPGLGDAFAGMGLGGQ